MAHALIVLDQDIDRDNIGVYAHTSIIYFIFHAFLSSFFVCAVEL